MYPKVRLFLILMMLAFNIRIWFGVYQHDEFASDGGLFVKHRPCWKWNFYSPTGMSDLTIDDLSEQSRVEELYFIEFVSSQGLSR